METDNNKSYLICVSDDANFYVPDALHIERNDDLMLVDTDQEACAAAERDGIKLIYGMERVPDGMYLDTPENRERIRREYEQNPGYPCFEAGQRTAGPGMTMGFGKG